MAALDFPASPTNGQVWLGTNGVTYQYQSATTSWVAVGSAPAGSGDFFAQGPSNFALTATMTTMLWSTVIVGNSGGYYNSSNGRWTPPAGRYQLYGSINGFLASATLISAQFRKNGTLVGLSTAINNAASAWGQAQCEVMVDANGTDWFDFQANANNGTTSTQGFWGAIPVGVVQSMAAPGTLQLWSENVLAAPASEIVVSAPRNAKRYELQWGSESVGATDGNLYIQGIENGVPTQANYSGQLMYSYGANQYISTVRANNAALIMINLKWFSGSVRLAPFANAGGLCGDLTAWAQDQSAGNRYFVAQGCNTGLQASNITGFRLVNAGNTPNFAAGSFLRCYVVQDTAGAIVGNTGRSAFNVRATTNLTYTGPGSINCFAAAATPVVDYDPEGVWSVANAEFTCPATGRYQFSLTQHADPTSGGQYAGAVISHLTSAAVVIRSYATPRVINTSGANSAMTTTQTLNMNAGEKVRFMLANPNAIQFTQHAVDATVITGGATLTFASGFRIS